MALLMHHLHSHHLQHPPVVCHKKTGPHIFSSPGPNISKCLDPPEQKFLKYLDHPEIFYPPVILNQHIA